MKILPLLLIQFLSILSANSYAQQHDISGEKLFIEKRCSRCHTIGRGRFVGPDLYKVKDRYTREEIVKWAENPQIIYGEKGKVPINEGYPPMPPMNLTQSDAQKIADYLTGFKLKQNLNEKGLIKGTITNETSGDNASDVELVLRSYLGDIKQDEKYEKADNDGKFSFSGLDWDRNYEITVLYDNAQYTSSKMVFEPNQDVIDLNLPVFESTESDKNVFLNNLHVIVYPSMDNKLVNVTLIYEFVNSGNTIFVGEPFKNNKDQRRTLTFTVPRDARDVNFINGLNPDNLVNQGNRYFDTAAFNPGSRNVVLSYNIPLESRQKTVRINPDYKLNNLIILSKKDELNVEIDGIENSKDVVIEDEVFSKYEKAGLESDESVLIILAGHFPVANIKKYIPVALFLLFVAAGLVNMKLKKAKLDFEYVNGNDRETVLKEIARLDDLKELDGIDEAEYRKKREVLMRILLKTDVQND